MRSGKGGRERICAHVNKYVDFMVGNWDKLYNLHKAFSIVPGRLVCIRNGSYGYCYCYTPA